VSKRPALQPLPAAARVSPTLGVGAGMP
jgi:hypothetical protein